MRVKEWPSSGVVEKVLDVAARCRSRRQGALLSGLQKMRPLKRANYAGEWE